jgi:hypothetical protein
VTANGRTIEATGKGTYEVEFPMGNNEKPTKIQLNDCYYSPDLAYTLISVSQMDRKGCKLEIESGICTIKSGPSQRVIGRIPEVRGLYRITPPSERLIANVASVKMTISQLHRKMGHVNHEYLRKMIKDESITGIEIDKDSKPEFCESCIHGKATRKPFPKLAGPKAKAYGGKIVSDLWGPAEVESIDHHSYVHTQKDQYTSEEKCSFLKLKSDAYESMKLYLKWVENQRGAKVKIYGSDGGGEFKGRFTEHLKSKGIQQQLTVHDSPQSNGEAERTNHMNAERVRTMLHASGLPKYLWEEAWKHSVLLRSSAYGCWSQWYN